MAKFSVEVTLTASVTYTVEVEESSESRAEDQAQSVWRSMLPEDFQVDKGYISDWDAEVTQLTWQCEACDAAISEDESRKFDEMCASCFKIAEHDDLIAAARRDHIPHSLIRSQRFWQKIASAGGVAAWGYAYEGGEFNR
jgi:hypothetical protein